MKFYWVFVALLLCAIGAKLVKTNPKFEVTPSVSTNKEEAKRRCDSLMNIARYYSRSKATRVRSLVAFEEAQKISDSAMLGLSVIIEEEKINYGVYNARN